MEKLIYQLWKKDDDSLENFKESLLSNLTKDLDGLVTELQINIADADVEPASGLAQSNYPPAPNAVIFLKVQSYFLAHTLEDHLHKVAKKIHGFVVSESVILDDVKKSPLGLRSEGFSQVVFLEKPETMCTFDWFEHWTKHHTKIAIETQSNFIYVQNSVVRPLQKSSPAFIAIIEECFPYEAMSDPEVFYDAENNPELLAKNGQVMMSSCEKFIDFKKIEVIPTSRYRIV
ncbi:EthD domain-containing protein [Gammaproteobacteria bacterium]|nr:EthD domain-containing protein [Gammaproteobacteria bacterium]